MRRLCISVGLIVFIMFIATSASFADCSGDFKGDGDIDGSDLSVIVEDFGRNDCDTGDPCEGNIVEDDSVDDSDLELFAVNFGLTDCDLDGVISETDNCPTIYNPDQTNDDGDNFGAACDCNDTDPDIYPGAPELCDSKDNQCPGDSGHGSVDEGCGVAAQVGTFHFNDDTYSVYLRFIGSQDVSAVTVTGPAGSGIVNAVLYDDGSHIDEAPHDGIFSNSLFHPLINPTLGEVYTFNYVLYGQNYQAEALVTGLVENFATLIFPSGAIDIATPDFQWTPASVQPVNGEQQLIVFKNGEDGAPWIPRPSWWIWSKTMDFNQTSITFNDDGTSTEVLIPGETYYWQVRTKDENGNSSQTYQMAFNYGADVSYYHVYGGDSFSTNEPNHWEKGYHPELYGYTYLGSASDSETFSGNYAYYIITTYEGEVIEVDAVQGSDNTYFETNITGNTTDWQNVGGSPDGSCATVGALYDAGGFIVINASSFNFESITVYLCDDFQDFPVDFSWEWLSSHEK